MTDKQGELIIPGLEDLMDLANPKDVVKPKEIPPTDKVEEHVGAKVHDHDKVRNFSCGICFETYNKDSRYPISLNCGHTFCYK